MPAIPPQIRRLKGGRMLTKVGGILTLLAPVVAWVIAAAIANDEGCRVIEAAGYMAEPVKTLTKLFLLCWLG